MLSSTLYSNGDSKNRKIITRMMETDEAYKNKNAIPFHKWATHQKGKIIHMIFYIRAESDFVFIGYSNGILRVHSLAKESIPRNDGMLSWSTENYWTISLHSPTGGSIREIYTIETQQDHLLVCCGQDGGIFAHKINQALDSVYQKTMDEKVCHICFASY